MAGGEHTPSEVGAAPLSNGAEDELTAPACESVADEPAEAEEDGVQEIVPERVVEAVLFSADSPLPAARIASVLGVGTARDVRQHIESLNRQYAEHGQAFRIEQIAAGYQMMTLPAYNTWLRKLLRARQEARLTPAAMETLAIVAYKQPCTRAEVESVRGVAVGEVMSRLREMNLVKIVGRAEDLGRPMLYGTTKRFLEVFGLPSLNDLPRVEALAGGDAPPKHKPPENTPVEPKQDADERAESVPPAVDTSIEESPGASTSQDDHDPAGVSEVDTRATTTPPKTAVASRSAPESGDSDDGTVEAVDEAP